MRLRFRPSFFSRRRDASADPAKSRGIFWRLQAKRGALALWCFILLSGTAFAAIQWRRVATVNSTLSANHLCYTDATDIICSTTAPYIDGSGNIGIGTTSPSAFLHVNGATEQLRLSYDAAHYFSLTAKPNGDGLLTGYSGHLYIGTYASTNSVSFSTNGALKQNSSSNSYFTGSGNLGIGTTSPATTLDVNGAASLRLGTDLTTTGSQNDVAISGFSSLRYAGVGAATFTGLASGQNGRVLYLHNASASTLTLSNQSASSSAANRIITGTGADLSVPTNTSVTLQYDSTDSRWRVTGSSNSANTLAAGSTGEIQFNGGTNLAADSNFYWDNTNKRLGIGTASPGAVLEINQGNLGNVAALKISNRGLGTTGISFPGISFLGNTGGATRIISVFTNVGGYTQQVAGSSLASSTQGMFSLESDATAAGSSYKSLLNLKPGGSKPLLTGQQSDGTDIFSLAYDGGIYAAGNVAIGTTSTASKLQVNGGAAVGYSTSTTAPTNGLAVNGQLGIGTASPNLGGFTGVVATINAPTGQNAVYETAVNGSIVGSLRANTGLNLRAHNAAPLAIYSDNNYISFFPNFSSTPETMRLTTAGNVAIGTTSTASKLQVNGGAAVGYSTSTTAPTDGLAVSGQLGVGTATPATDIKADINGAVKVAGTGSETCTAATYGAMRYNSAGNYFEICSP